MLLKEELADVKATCVDLVFISLIDGDKGDLDQDAIPHFMKDNSIGSVHILATKLKLLEQVYNIIACPGEPTNHI